jgi:hypothetical protein
LTVLAASSIVESDGLQFFFEFRLASDTISHTRYGHAARFWNFGIALLATAKAFADRQSAFCQLDSGLHCGIYLFLHGLIPGPTDSHDLFLLIQKM